MKTIIAAAAVIASLAGASAAFAFEPTNGPSVEDTSANIDRTVVGSIVRDTTAKADRAPVERPGPTPVLFFAPDQIRKRAGEWGYEELEARFMSALRAFVADASWLNVQQHVGPEALLAAYHDVLEGRARPDEGHIIRPV